MPKSNKPEQKEKKGFFKWLSSLNSPETETSSSGLMGSVMIIIGLAIFMILSVFYMVRISEAVNVLSLIDKTIIIMSLGAGLLGLRKFSGVIGSSSRQKVDNHTLREMIDVIHEGGKKPRSIYEEEEEVIVEDEEAEPQVLGKGKGRRR